MVKQFSKGQGQKQALALSLRRWRGRQIEGRKSGTKDQSAEHGVVPSIASIHVKEVSDLVSEGTNRSGHLTNPGPF